MPSTTSNTYAPFDLIITHGKCLDGHTSAWIARAHSPKATFHEGLYGEPAPEVKGKRVLVADFSYDRETMIRMNEEAEFLLVLDHHKTAQEALSGLDFVVFDMEQSGAGMTWRHLFPGNPLPDMVKFVEDRDIWRFQYPETKVYHAAITALPLTFEAWDLISVTPTYEMLAKGDAILEFTNNLCQRYSKKAAPAMLGKQKVRVLNIPIEFRGETADVLLKEDPTTPILLWSWNGHKNAYGFSLRSCDDGPDISGLARQFGGGGHRNASGFLSDTLPFELIEEET